MGCGCCGQKYNPPASGGSTSAGGSTSVTQQTSQQYVVSPYSGRFVVPIIPVAPDPNPPETPKK